MPASRGRGAGRGAGRDAGLAKPKRQVTKKRKPKSEAVHAPGSGVDLCGCKVGAGTCAKPEGHAAREKAIGARTQHQSWEGAEKLRTHVRRVGLNLGAAGQRKPVKILYAPTTATSPLTATE